MSRVSHLIPENMSRQFRRQRNVFPRLVQRFAPGTLGFLTLLVVAGGVFLHQISPMRDPSFVPNSGNAGSLLPWAKDISENTLLLGSFWLAILLASNLVVVLSQWRGARTQTISNFSSFLLWTWIGVIFFICIFLTFFGYLCVEWLID